GDVEVERGHQVEVLEVLLGDERDRDVEDVELVLLDQVKQEVERPLEHVEPDLVAGRGVVHRGRGRCRHAVHVVSVGAPGHTGMPMRFHQTSDSHLAGTATIMAAPGIRMTPISTNGPYTA